MGGDLNAIDLGYPSDSKVASDAREAKLLKDCFDWIQHGIIDKLKPSKDELKTACDHAVKVLEALIEGAGFLGGLVTGGLSIWAAHELVKHIRDKENEISADLQKAIDIACQVFEGIFAPFTFGNVATKWGTEFRSVCDDTVSDLGSVKLDPGANDWTGSAATRYSAEAKAQEKAVEALATKCQKMEDHLRDWAKECTDLYDKWIEILADSVGKLVSLLLKISVSEDPVELASAADDALDFAGDMVTNFMKFSSSLFSLAQDIASEAGKLESEDASAQGLGHGNKWPEAYGSL